MHTIHSPSSIPHAPRRLPLAVACCLAGFAGSSLAAPSSASPSAPPPPIVVTTCDDAGPGSLRAAASAAIDGSVIDLSQLNCSFITLLTGAIALSGNVTVQGPGSELLGIGGDYSSRVFDHAGPGTLSVSGVRLMHGKYVAETDARGGCVRSSGNVSLTGVRVSNCTLQVRHGAAAGAGLFVEGELDLVRSVVSRNTAMVGNIDPQPVRGGGFAAGSLVAKYSTIAYNSLQSDAGYGGGAFVYGTTGLAACTVTGNRATVAGAIVASTDPAQPVTISNSTISGNFASRHIGGVRAGGALTIANSTIVTNSDEDRGIGVYLDAVPATLHSSIIAYSGDVDLDGSAGASVDGAANLIVQSALPVPADTISADPQLWPLANNGGPTWTHALKEGSPAIDAGDNAMSLKVDQRGSGFARSGGAGPDIGAFEVQDRMDSIFTNGFD